MPAPILYAGCRSLPPALKHFSRCQDAGPESNFVGRPRMTTARTQGYRPGLVDLASGQISREIFVNDAIYAEEQEKIFARAWLFVGHESQIPNQIGRAH